MRLLVKDSMVLIHLAKLALLEITCLHFGTILIPELVFVETVKAGKAKGYSDAFLIEEMVQQKLIKVKPVINKELVERANQFNIFGGEAEAIALYWQEHADILATDDDNVRSKKEVLKLSLIGTPAILVQLFRAKKLSKEKAVQSVSQLRKIGWFNSEVLDRIVREVSV